MRTIEISKHASFMPIPDDPSEVPGTHDIHVQVRPDLPRNSQPAPITVRNGAIYMSSRNVPSKGIRPGMVLLLDLRRAAAVLADDTYEIATEEHIRREMERQTEYKKDMAEKDRQIRMQSQGIENNINISPGPQAPIQVSVVMPHGFRMVPDTEPDAAPVRRRGRARSSAVAASPAIDTSDE